ncbi:autophagy protein 5 [Orussus abietinus]|uniref:autophagy protein 5 n=1 Tax=Orussus abietinus TaxID=222816 RepID=UPI000625CFDC|nr:autophagy protein 5 [Orussus abietinus]XP_012279168.1 autophagy protein 5 [Orussus abietinus]XP_012279177.1 autophagy protein 5 [Orussus abietinus]
MSNDREVLREIWEGKIPVCFQLDSEEVCELQAPDSFYLMVSRLSYFPVCTDKVRKHFLRHIQQDKQENEMWLEFNGIPLKWHFPIGVLLDLYSNDMQLPWNIIVHFEKFPENVLMHCRNKDVVEAYFLSCVKEADTLKHRGQIMSSMQKKDHTQLWHGLINDKFDQFWAINRRLMEPNSHEEGFKYIPFRCYTSEDKYVQKLVKPVDEDGHRKTLKHLLAEVFPDMEQVTVRTHGIVPPLETPIQWMSEHLSYPDNFLHLCVVTS